MSSPRELGGHPPNGLYIKDDFLSNDLVTDTNIGELGWDLTQIVAAPTLAYQTAQQAGVLRITTDNGAAAAGAVLHLFADPLIIQTDVQFGARIRLPAAGDLTNSNFRIGLDDSVTVTRPTVGITFESADGVLSCHTDSADHGDESQSVTGHPDLTSGTTLVAAEFVDLEARCHGTNAQGGPANVDFYVNAEKVATVPSNIDNDEEVEPKIAVFEDTTSAGVSIDVDFFWLWIPRS